MANSTTVLTSIPTKDLTIHMRHRAHVLAGLTSGGQANNIKPVRRSHLSLGSLSRGDVNHCRLSEFSRLHLPRDLPQPEALEKEQDMALKDAYASACLSEIVYKGQDVGHEVAEQAMRHLESLLPVDVKLSKLQWGKAGKHQNYIVAETTDVLYCAFLGTKSPRDILTSFNYKGNKSYLPELGENAKLHQGYVARAAAVPAEQLWRLATARGKRLVFTGHSMGGAIAHLCTLRLLSQLPQDLHYTVRSIGFATPLLGAAAVAEAIATRGWAKALKNYLVPEDWVPNAMNLWQPHVILDAVTHGAVSKEASAEAEAAEAASAASEAASEMSSRNEEEQETYHIRRSQTQLPSNQVSLPVKRALTQQAKGEHQNNTAVFKIHRQTLPIKKKLPITATWMMSTLTALLSIAFRAGDLILLVPRIFAPRYVHLGQQVYLNRRISREPTKYIQNSNSTSSTTSTGSNNSVDHLVPLGVKPSFVSAHRMITYRVRMIQLYDYQVSTQ